MVFLAPEWLTHLFSLLAGLIVGSFLNVVVARVPLKQSIVKPRSRCPKCGYEITWRDNIPLVSYALLLGKCRGCKAQISVRYPLIEILTGVLFLAVELKFGFSWLLFVHDWPFVALLVAITFIDLEHRLIPDVLSLPGIALGLATAGFVPGLGWTAALIGAAVGFGVFYFFAWTYYKLTGRSGLGGGDIKLLSMLGAFLGFGGTFAAILISSIFGSLVGITWGLINRKEGQSILTVAIPYGPFLVIGGLYYYLLGDILWFQFTIPT